MIEHAKLKELLYYNEDTGDFVWKFAYRKSIKIGSIAGHRHGNYIRISIYGIKYYAHRLAWFYVHGKWPKFNIDHKNNNALDNSIKNLREVTQLENTKNSSLNKNNTSGHKGVHFDKKWNKWIAQCWTNRKNNFIGSFENIEDAIKAVKRFREIHHGEFANHG